MQEESVEKQVEGDAHQPAHDQTLEEPSKEDVGHTQDKPPTTDMMEIVVIGEVDE